MKVLYRFYNLPPYVAVPTLTRVLERHKVLISRATVPSLATGIYFCDVYRSVSDIPLAPGAILIYMSSSKIGYSNYSTQEVGVASIQVGSTYTLSTYSLVPRYNVAGQAINVGTLPTDLTGTTHVYSYLQDI